MKTSSVALATDAAEAATASLDGPTQRFHAEKPGAQATTEAEWNGVCHTNLYPLVERLFM